MEPLDLFSCNPKVVHKPADNIAVSHEKLNSIYNLMKGCLMAISSVSSNVNTAAAVQAQSQTARAKEVENDNDKDDGASSAAATQAAPRPTVNTSGQVIGSIVDTQA